MTAGSTAPAVDAEGLIALTQAMVRTPSPTGREEAISRLVEAEMRRAGFDEVRRDPIGNVLGFLHGRDPRLRLMFNGHIDHAETGSMPDPYSGDLVDGRRFGREGTALVGRAACDMKGAVAAMIYAAKAVRDAETALAQSVVVTAVVKEEAARGEGILYVLEEDGVRADMAVSGEATNLEVYVGHRGKLEFLVTTKGRTCHASNPGNGVNAIFLMQRFLESLQRDYELPSHEFLGDCTMTVIDIVARPGRLTPVVPDRCEIVLDRRYLPGESAESVEGEVRALLDRLARDGGFEGDVSLLKDFPVLFCDPGEKVVELARGARRKVMGDPGTPGAWRFGVDGTFIQKAGIPCVGFGPGSEEFAHTPEDHVFVDDLVTAARIYGQIMMDACGEENGR